MAIDGKKVTSHNQNNLLLLNIGQLVTLRSSKVGPRRGSQMRALRVIENGAVLCGAGKVISVGKTSEAVRDRWIRRSPRKIEEIDCAGKVVLPGFVDAHTHPAFVQPRLMDFEKRIAGATYEEIAASGGGIRSSLNAVRSAKKNELAEHVLSAFVELAAHGTTAFEAKSGYGLSLDAELKSLEAIRAAALHWPGTVVPTLLGAHVIPREFENRRKDYVRSVCEEMIPAAAKRNLAIFADVFCDRGAFDEEETLKILQAARLHGLELRVHISQLTRTPLERPLALRPTSLDHLDHVNDNDIYLLAKSDCVATLVPGANYFLGSRDYPPARKLIDAGAAVALATDYNPGSSPVTSMPFVLSLACTHMKMTPAEAITAATINGAYALGLGGRKGSVEPGKDADLAIFDIADYREIPYWVGKNSCSAAIAGGKLLQAGVTAESFSC